MVLAVALLATAGTARADDPAPVPDLSRSTPEANTSLKQFPQNLGRNFVALFTHENILPLVIGAAATGGAAVLDHRIHRDWSVQRNDSTLGHIGDNVGKPYFLAPAMLGLLVGGHYSQSERFSSFTYALAQAAIIDTGLVEGLKLATRRMRPDGSNDRSFPAGHAASAFMIAAVVDHYYGRVAGIIGYTAATFVGFSRIRNNSHWASDVAAGATIGYIVGRTTARRTGLSVRVGRKARLVPFLKAQDRSVGLRFEVGTE